ncbi:MAG: hypothetical protein A2566_03445 [Candidatus Zambryskibacteria bacterium RIFOXYD1_FULL_40_13]|nr:MAG: polymerase III epsilon subunit protein [Parcubacteria group bacterium GW2011_GWC1_39_12]KKR19331.1 MAG: polymerase III epsilon subunit protein [Parcubacteria group bacterium GW2011_GWF1_39_37]KKR35285.1 MAG: polymerase III epsilon subunit protein [Parcubacteria group bacterium GW2011_GWC2_40_10]KKR52282.1 MAG: polymerase III epsilon subunit protein [Parcubacteria group bacterium GW2011_GWE1_40_20]KKR66254.1 MAG: polymerase III epsilon subunit protein [Parcubacteria group bacterium GW201
MKISIVDVETTGLDAEINEIIEIGLVVFDDQSFEILDTLDVRVKPLHPEICHPLAYARNGYTEESWRNSIPLENAMEMFKEKTNQTMFCAHNMTLDYDFISKALKKCSLENNFDRHKVDIFSLAWAKIPHDKIKSWSLKSICEYLEIPPEPEVHRGINGAMAEYEVYKKLMLQ